MPCSPGANVSKYLPLVHYRPSGSSAPENRGRNVRRRYQASHDGDVPLAEEPLHCQECLLGFCMGHIAAIDYFGSHDAQPRSVTRWPRILDKATNSRGLATACHAEKGGLHPTRGVHQIRSPFLFPGAQDARRQRARLSGAHCIAISLISVTGSTHHAVSALHRPPQWRGEAGMFAHPPPEESRLIALQWPGLSAR